MGTRYFFLSPPIAIMLTFMLTANPHFFKSFASPLNANLPISASLCKHFLQYFR